MALRTVHHVAGQSNAVGAAQKAALTDLRYDISDSAVQNIYKNAAAAVVGPATMSIPSQYFSVDAPIGHRRKAAGEANPIVMRYGFASTALASGWRQVATDNWTTYFATWYERLDEMLSTTFPGDTFEHRSLTWVQGESDADSGTFAPAYEANLRLMIPALRRELAANLPIFIVRLSSAYNAGTVVPANLAYVRNAADAVTDIARVYSVSADAVPLQADKLHYTADGLMMLGDLVADAMAADGLENVTQYTDEVRAFASQAAAETFADAAQLACGSRDENPANGGFGVRGSGARDPWPTTSRAAVKKHPVRNEWAVSIDSVMVAEGSLDCTTDLRPFDPSWWNYIA